MDLKKSAPISVGAKGGDGDGAKGGVGDCKPAPI